MSLNKMADRSAEEFFDVLEHTIVPTHPMSPTVSFSSLCHSHCAYQRLKGSFGPSFCIIDFNEIRQMSEKLHQ